MKLKQLEYLREIARQALNISNAASALGTSQPGMSRQIQDLERELGTPLFVRTGNRIVGLTETGSAVLGVANRLLGEAENIRSIAADARGGTARMVVATSHLHARYSLPASFARLRNDYPKLELQLLQTAADRIGALVEAGEADVGVATGDGDSVEGHAPSPRLVVLFGRPIRRVAIMQPGHPLANRRRLSLQGLAASPLVGYGTGSPTGRHIEKAFADAGILPQYVVRANDSDVIKTYVAAGLGIGIVPAMCLAGAPGADPPALAAIDVTHLLPAANTVVLLRRNMFLRRHVVDFIRAVAPGLTRADIQIAVDTS